MSIFNNNYLKGQFVPKHPETQPKIDRLEKSETRLDIEKIVDEVVNNLELVVIKKN